MKQIRKTRYIRVFSCDKALNHRESKFKRRKIFTYWKLAKFIMENEKNDIISKNDN